jgi:hypothetical protein
MQKGFSEITRRWLARLSFAFLVIAFFLGWEGYKRYAAASQIADWRTLLDFFAAMLSVVLAFIGLAERHRPRS